MLGAHRTYAEAGFVALPAPLSAADLATLRAGLEAWAGSLPPVSATARGYGILRHNLWREVPAFRAVLAQGGLAQQAAALLGASSVTLFQDNLIWKTPGTETGVQWHQDYAYWPLSAPAGVTLWLALDDADEANGCLHYIPGTHREGERQPTNFTTPGAAPWRQDLPPLDAAQRAPAEAVSAPLLAGGLLAHHPLTWHMSGGNPTARHRRAWSMTWITDAVRWEPAHAPHPDNHWLQPTTGAPVVGPTFLRFSREGVLLTGG